MTGDGKNKATILLLTAIHACGAISSSAMAGSDCAYTHCVYSMDRFLQSMFYYESPV